MASLALTQVRKMIEQDVSSRATEKVAGFMDSLTGAAGNLSSAAYGIGGAGLGAAAGMSFGYPGALLGGLAGGLMGYGGANAINQQGNQQNMNDNLLAKASLDSAMGNSPVDQQQNQVLQGIVDYLHTDQQNKAMEQEAMAQDPYAMSGGQDYAMGGGQDPYAMRQDPYAAQDPNQMQQGQFQQQAIQGTKQSAAREEALINHLALKVLAEFASR